jgi:hypothetical protein
MRILIIAALVCSGCSPSSSIVTDPQTATAMHEITNTPGSLTQSHTDVIDPATGKVLSHTESTTTVQPTTSERESAAGKGEGIKAEGDKANVTHDGTAPAADLGKNKPSAKGGDSSFTASVSKMLNPTSAFFWVGLVFIAGGGAILWFIPVAQVGGICCVGIGVFLIAASVYPLMLIGVGVLALAAIGYEGYKHGFFREGGRALVADAKTAGVMPAIESVIGTDRSQAVGTDAAAVTKLKQLET